MQRKNRPPRSGGGGTVGNNDEDEGGGVFSTVSLSSSSFDGNDNDINLSNEGGHDERANRKLVFNACADIDDNGHHGSRRDDGPLNTNINAAMDTNNNIEMTASSSQTITKALGSSAVVQPSDASSSLVDGLVLPTGSTITTTDTATTAVVTTATVKRNRFGTRPFDVHWLNVDCCGLICAAITYALHMYGMYAYCLVLLPPWLSSMNDDGYRSLSASCYVNRSIFCTISCLAMYSHYRAMMTNPGAVPPDALPLPSSGDDDDDDDENDNDNENLDLDVEGVDYTDELDTLIKGERSPTKNSINRIMGGSGGGGISGGGGGGMSPMIGTMARDNNNNNNSNHGGRLAQAAIMATTTGTAATAAAAMVLASPIAIAGGVAAAVTGGGGAINNTSSESNLGVEVDQQQQQQQRTTTRQIIMPMQEQQQQQQRNPDLRRQVEYHERGKRMCRRCQSYKPPRAHHCSICKRCIIKMDHHCPWINNCVGIGNHKYFLLFIFYTFLSCHYSFSFLVYRFFHCIGGTSRATSSLSSNHHYHHTSASVRCVDHPSDLLPLIGLFIEAMLFGLFTLCMMCDQWDVVMTNLTHIDRLKQGGQHGGQYNISHHHQQQQQQHAGVYGRLPPHHEQPVMVSTSRSSKIAMIRAGINEVFGTLTSVPRSRFHYTWLSPFHCTTYPDIVKDDIFGYCRPCGGSNGSSSSESSSGRGPLSTSSVTTKGNSSTNLMIAERGVRRRRTGNGTDVADIV